MRSWGVGAREQQGRGGTMRGWKPQHPFDWLRPSEALPEPSPGQLGAAPRRLAHSAGLEQVRSALVERYAVERELGRGGMAVIYLAVDVRHRRQVAVKVLRPELCAGVGAKRFVREIQTEASLTHPNIVPLLDSGDADGIPYYVMPFVAGESLRALLDRVRRLSIDEALRIAAEVADALDCAHRHNVLHRDVKPENILLEEGHAVVVDFGVARAISRANAESPEERITAGGMTVGTLEYMSPEQARGDTALDGRSDIYGLGSVLYEMLTGAPPFAARSMQALMALIQASPPPSARAVRPEVPDSVDALVRRCLAKQPRDRFATGGELRLALEASRRETGRSPG